MGNNQPGGYENGDASGSKNCELADPDPDSNFDPEIVKICQSIRTVQNFLNRADIDDRMIMDFLSRARPTPNDPSVIGDFEAKKKLAVKRAVSSPESVDRPVSLPSNDISNDNLGDFDNHDMESESIPMDVILVSSQGNVIIEDVVSSPGTSRSPADVFSALARKHKEENGSVIAESFTVSDPTPENSVLDVASNEPANGTANVKETPVKPSPSKSSIKDNDFLMNRRLKEKSKKKTEKKEVKEKETSSSSAETRLYRGRSRAPSEPAEIDTSARKYSLRSSSGFDSPKVNTMSFDPENFNGEIPHEWPVKTLVVDENGQRVVMYKISDLKCYVFTEYKSLLKGIDKFMCRGCCEVKAQYSDTLANFHVKPVHVKGEWFLENPDVMSRHRCKPSKVAEVLAKFGIDKNSTPRPPKKSLPVSSRSTTPLSRFIDLEENGSVSNRLRHSSKRPNTMDVTPPSIKKCLFAETEPHSDRNNDRLSTLALLNPSDRSDLVRTPSPDPDFSEEGILFARIKRESVRN
ncbi:hypothetical protein WR25_01274 [Diploscapter pachys]|uniref:Uncharacterized protein n=1 Tax=Diploscapter pachys TaxID=2018661 RepID=A0A2A2LXZ8_9BILA|nr:hypothetical protein WR25_01274 [Diploscapter pachys]